MSSTLTDENSASVPSSESKAATLIASETAKEDDESTKEIKVGNDKSRGQWKNPIDFLFSMISYAVGLGNVWRFPYLCYKNGGGSFIFAYIIFFIFGAVPVFLMEVSVGQYLQRGAMEMWSLCPIFTGVGIGSMVISAMCIWYFCVIVSWAMHYLIASCQTTFPWENCDNSWNDPVTCIPTSSNRNESCNYLALTPNLTGFQTPVEQYWEKRVLNMSPTITDFDDIRWEIVGLNVLAWLIVYVAMCRGITHAQKFVYFCAAFPYLVIAVLLGRSLWLDGAMEGIRYYLKPKLDRLLDITVWKDAGTQVFYSYGVGFGTLIALGSHNKFTHNCYRLRELTIRITSDAILMCFINGGTTGFAIFSVIGFMSYSTCKPIDIVVKGGPGLAFLVYPEAANHLPLKQLWAVLFFLMIIILGLDSQVCMVEGLFTSMEDRWPTVLREWKRVSMAMFCLFFFLISFPMYSNAGLHWLNLIDAYGATGYALLFIVFFEVVGIAWAFGASRIREAMYEMLGRRPCYGWLIMWKYLTPLTALFLFVLCCWFYQPLKYPDGRSYPAGAEVGGFILSSLSMICIPIYALYYLFIKKSRYGLWGRFYRGIRVQKKFVPIFTPSQQSVKEAEGSSD
ncbi:Sodium-and chloride-dependent creatine transporter 1 [Aphelenchoides besseyi]|nr:Sodium-and chloride-dependent creatine transporter 1 [Aphelenchoides besseyi]